MNGGNFEDRFDAKTASHRSASVEASLQKITLAIALLDQAGEDIAVAHLQAGLDVLSTTRQKRYRFAQPVATWVRPRAHLYDRQLR